MGKRGQKFRLILSVVLLCGLPGLVAAAECREDRIALRGDWGQAQFTVEVADDDEERAQGLMQVETMPKSAGMLFVYDRPKTVRFWMKNTLISLDMLFADETGTIRHIQHKAEPLSERLIFGGRGIQYVLEINGGMARALGIAEDSQLRHPAIPGEVAAWPC